MSMISLTADNLLSVLTKAADKEGFLIIFYTLVRKD